MSTFYRDKLDGEQKRVYQRLVNGENIFLTGNAGTGKSFLVEAYNEYCEENGIKLLKAAPTGVAACNIKGVTLHRLFRLKTDTRSMLKEVRKLPEEVKSTLNLCSVILIDEISMVRIDVFDKVMQYIALANKDREKQKRRPIQLIFVGDFYQLAPVVPPEDRKILDLYYGREIGNGFAFQSKYWRTLNVQLEKLTEVHRQNGDKLFCTALDKCKEGDTDCLSFFSTEVAKNEIEDAIWVVGKNDDADSKNNQKLNEIFGAKEIFRATYTGNATEKDKFCEDEFVCKVGARVLMLVNEPLGLYQNGSMGTVVAIGNDTITVDIDRKDENGNNIKPLRVDVGRYEFCKHEYQEKEVSIKITDEHGKTTVRKEKELVLVETGKAIQFPMKLGYAITIHKAQGQTYDKMNYYAPVIFQDGQLYVALSRCRFADSLYIANRLYPSMVRTSEEVVKYYKNPDEYSFFGKENEFITIQIPSECEAIAKILFNPETYSRYKEEILEFAERIKKTDEQKITVEKTTKRKKKTSKVNKVIEFKEDEYVEQFSFLSDDNKENNIVPEKKWYFYPFLFRKFSDLNIDIFFAAKDTNQLKLVLKKHRNRCSEVFLMSEGTHNLCLGSVLTKDISFFEDILSGNDYYSLEINKNSWESFRTLDVLITTTYSNDMFVREEKIS